MKAAKQTPQSKKGINPHAVVPIPQKTTSDMTTVNATERTIENLDDLPDSAIRLNNTDNNTLVVIGDHERGEKVEELI